MRAKLGATTAATPDALIDTGATSRDDPQPKFAPATMMSPALTLSTKSGSRSAMQCFANSTGSVRWQYRPGMMTSVLMLGPYFQTRPRSFSICWLPLDGYGTTRRLRHDGTRFPQD